MTEHTVVEVCDVMTGDLIAVRPVDRAGRALDVLLQSGLHALPILDEDSNPVGLVTLADLVPIDRQLPVGERFCGPPLTIDHRAPIAAAASLMRQEYVHHLIVTDGKTAVGMLSSYDLLKVLEDES